MIDPFLKALGIYSTGLILITSVLGYLAKKAVEIYLNKDLEKFKTKLSSENEKAKLEFEKEIESYRADLNLLYSKQIQLYSKKSEIIESLYHRLVELNTAMFEMTNKFRNIKGKEAETIKKEELDRVTESANLGNAFFRFYSKNKIYFNRDTCGLIETLQQQFLTAHHDYSFQHVFGLPPDKLTYEMAKKAGDKVRDEIPKLMEELEDDFRLILGVMENKIKESSSIK